MLHAVVPFFVISLCLKSLLPWLWLLLLWWLWCVLVCHLFISYHGPLHDGASCNIGLAWCGSATTADSKVPWMCCWPYLCATAATSISDASSDLCQLCHGFSTGRFLCQSLASHHFVYYMFGICSCVCFLLSGAMLDAIFPSGGSIIGVCTIATLWKLTHGRHMCNLVMVLSPNQVCTEWQLPALFWVGGALCYSISFSPAILSIWWGIQLWGLGRELPIPLPSL